MGFTSDHFKWSVFLYVAACPAFSPQNLYSKETAAKIQPVDNLVLFDRGHEDQPRSFESASRCNEKPCVLTQRGAIQLSPEVAKSYTVEIGLLQRGFYQNISYFQQSRSFEQKLSERILNRTPNRQIINLSEIVERGETQTIFIYGIRLHYELDEGDALILRLRSARNPKDFREYFFRYHHDEFKLDIDVAFVQPLNQFNPNPNRKIQGAYSSAALSFSAMSPLDPDLEYNFLSKTIRAVRFNLFVGILIRKDIAFVDGDRIVKEKFDGYVGVGLTFFKFLAAGYGVNLFQTPHSGFPFIGVELRHLAEFIRALNTDTHSQWREYLEEENQRLSAPQ